LAMLAAMRRGSSRVSKLAALRRSIGIAGCDLNGAPVDSGDLNGLLGTRLSNDPALLCFSRADKVSDDHQTSCDANAGL
jgi:hypothetical protein